ncbi:DUF3040 domain-containing protein [Actinomyces faecalis]|uniref:DUF3040 domain-containing protein n=1 Tax=Actinomyces faecalis TaxID=2722820 RepID=UPI0015519D2B|nr:DUF3040 domain-containing protein [Actinomyces faecalis]
MALTEREQQVLRDLEEQLHEDDPTLVSSMRQGDRQPGRLSPRHVGAGVALVLLGLTVVIVGVAVGHGIVSILIGVAGFALAVWGVTLMLTRTESLRAGRGATRSAGTSRPARRASFMDRQSERWERRRDNER